MTASQAAGTSSLSAAWNDNRDPLSNWVRAVYAAFEDSGLDGLDAAEQVGCNVAELESVLRLAILDDATLDLISRARPAMTTWFLLTELPASAIPTVLENAEHITNAESEYRRVYQAINELLGGIDTNALQNLDADALEFAERKAKAYLVWKVGSQHYKALRDFAKRRRSGRPLTTKQATYALSLLRELVESDTIRVPSPDGDDEDCQRIIMLVS